MPTDTATLPWREDYSLGGKNAELAVSHGLAEATWYRSPIPRETMRELLVRRDGPAVRDTLLWFFLLAVSGYGGYQLWGGAWAILPFAAYGVLYASSSDSRWHESSHGTAFKTDWMNDVLYEIASFMVLRESVPWRWSHTRHHSDTSIVGLDPEIAVPRPTNFWNVFLTFFNVLSLRNYVRNVLLHCIGRVTAAERTYIPEAEFGKVFLRARIYVLIYASVIGTALYTQSWLPLMFIGLPSFYGAWLMPVYGFTQHAGLAENVLDHRLNCRTVEMNGLNRYLYWNMNFHIEHHMFPLVPFHALPRLHELMRADCPPPYKGLFDAYREIIPALLRQAKDPTYFVERPLPQPATATLEDRNPALPEHAAAPTAARGWLAVCESSQLRREDALRFDHEGKTFAVYRAADGRVFATEGYCTHGNAHLADGMVKGHIIECAKHNGRFDLRDGSPARQPVCVGLKTFEAREDDGRVWVNLVAAGGAGAEQAAITHRFRVVSNQNVATFIKELILEPLEGSPVPRYQPGDYLQFDIPAYPERSLEDVDVAPRFADTWKAMDAFALTAKNASACRRNYSLASNPALEATLRFNIRLATPPHGLDKAGVGSAYVFGLQPGDTVTAIGPFGDFHVRETGREMVYLGGGAGMAPLRAHLSHLLETRASTTRISFWYGARSRQELFYQDYFEQLASAHPNFSFHPALSEPLPADAWTLATGFIHEVLLRDYLQSHSDPKTIDFFLCGPPAMIAAATAMLASLGVDPRQIAFDEF